ncbi:hypothetical protein [Claveliimonas bilis]|uniref:hypothetical protein n=1 Tax=Claveliimonas bilis TaxID=3028070 RepID=UPI00292DD421|nr:hypothetical protein [Claveliimonas bilis]BDZ81402.1 hypothetical protein Lac3_26110 [Claveliimonas bilis]
MRRKGRTRKEQKNDSIAAYDSMENNVSGEAARWFHKRAYEIGAPGVKKEARMTVGELVDIIYAEVAAGHIMLGDEIPESIKRKIGGENEKANEYLERKIRNREFDSQRRNDAKKDSERAID